MVTYEVTLLRHDVFKETTEDWCGSYLMRGNPDDIMLVRVSLCQTGPNPPINGTWRVCVWGNDDCGMEKDFTSVSEAWACFLEVIRIDDVTRTALKALGFKRA